MGTNVWLAHSKVNLNRRKIAETSYARRGWAPENAFESFVRELVNHFSGESDCRDEEHIRDFHVALTSQIRTTTDNLPRAQARAAHTQASGARPSSAGSANTIGNTVDIRAR